MPTKKSSKPAVSLAQKFKLKERLGVFMVLVMAATVVYSNHKVGLGNLFNANLLESPAPFDGTVYPVDKVPNWLKWNGDNKITKFSDISSNMLIDLPAYSISQLQTPEENLVWGKKEHDDIRNAQLTYSVVYMGNYELDHKENAGSHVAVDIRMPEGTPIKSIANGKVIKASVGEDGFGHHVVIEHIDVPDPDNPNKKTTLYSSYSHMSDVVAEEGDIVKKGEIIGKSGDTGTATTPHLHFQIDKKVAPWHPFWPFTWAETQEAGLDFFGAINAGLGMEIGKKNTINPMPYVQKYLSGGNIPSNPEPEVVEEPQITPEEKPEPQIGDGLSGGQNEVEAEKPPISDQPTIEEGINQVNQIDTSLIGFELSGEKFSLLNQGVGITAKVDPSTLEKMKDGDVIEIDIEGVGESLQNNLKKSDFINGVAHFNVMSDQVGTATVTVGKSWHKVHFIEQVMPLVSLGVETEQDFRVNEAQEIKVVTLDENGFRTPSDSFPGIIELVAKEGSAEFNPSQLTENDFVDGEAAVEMQPTSEERLVIRAQGGALVGESESLSVNKSDFFTDVTPSNPHYKAIKYLKENDIITGYPDGTFQPKKTVNRVEALKMLMLAFNVEEGSATELPFKDTDQEAWYAETLATAFQKQIVKGYEDGTFKPSNTVVKSEYLKMLFETNDITPSFEIKANPYNDVPANIWYAGYAYLTNKQNLLDVINNELKAGEGMTRGDVAETIYRMKYMLDNGMVSYAER